MQDVMSGVQQRFGTNSLIRSQSAKAGAAQRHQTLMNSIRARRHNDTAAMKLTNPSVQSLEKMLKAEKNPIPQAEVGQVGQSEEEKNKTQRIKIHYYELNQDQREQYFRIKSAKKEKKRNDDIKRKEEIHEWKIQ